MLPALLSLDGEHARLQTPLSNREATSAGGLISPVACIGVDTTLAVRCHVALREQQERIRPWCASHPRARTKSVLQTRCGTTRVA